MYDSSVKQISSVGMESEKVFLGVVAGPGDDDEAVAADVEVSEAFEDDGDAADGDADGEDAVNFEVVCSRVRLGACWFVDVWLAMIRFPVGIEEGPEDSVEIDGLGGGGGRNLSSQSSIPSRALRGSLACLCRAPMNLAMWS